jgi:hypothetical protein
MKGKLNLLLVPVIFTAVTVCKSQTVKAQDKILSQNLLAHVDSGYIDQSGKLIIKTDYRFHGSFSNDLARVWKTTKENDKEINKWGFIDATGKVVIKPVYDWAFPFSDGLAAVNIGCTINYNTVRGVTGEDILWAKKEGGKWLYIDNKGKVLFETLYSEVGMFHNGLAPVEKDEKWGYIDKTGKEVVPLIYDQADELIDGMGAVLKGNKWGFINRQGKLVIEPKFTSRIELMGGGILLGVGFSDGLAWVDNGKDYSSGKKWGVIDTTGNFVIEPQYEDYGSDFSDGLTFVKINGKYCIIDKSAMIIAETDFDNAWRFYEGLAPFEKNKKWGAVDVTGKIIIEPQFDNPFKFNQGLAAVGIGQFKHPIGYIDKTGTWVIAPKSFNEAWDFKKINAGNENLKK